MADDPNVVTLSLISHTNVGKTTLARTLLRRDVGEVLDQAHVTDLSAAYTMLEADGKVLRLWDTPGFGDTARLLKRLRRSDNPLLWFLGQTWDRFADRPLWCSQQAIQNVRAEAELILYLVNATEDPAGAGYVGLEMEILGWAAKPVIALLNQTGPPGEPESERRAEKAWRDHLERFVVVREVLSLDAFARCWVQEGVLLDRIHTHLADSRKAVFGALRQAWWAQNLEIFERSVVSMAEALVASATDGVEVSKVDVVRAVLARGEVQDEMASARRELSERFARRTADSINLMIGLHGLAGRSAMQLSEAARENFGAPSNVPEGVKVALGAALTGALGGIAADAVSGGLTLGGGALLGGLGGFLGTYLLARGYNLVRGEDNRVRWSRDHFREQFRLSLLGYLAVAHFGRGRGEWVESTQPDHWRRAVEEAIDARRDEIEGIWRRAGVPRAEPVPLRRSIEDVLRASATDVFRRLYPDSGAFVPGALPASTSAR